MVLEIWLLVQHLIDSTNVYNRILLMSAYGRNTFNFQVFTEHNLAIAIEGQSCLVACAMEMRRDEFGLHSVCPG